MVFLWSLVALGGFAVIFYALRSGRNVKADFKLWNAAFSFETTGSKKVIRSVRKPLRPPDQPIPK